MHFARTIFCALLLAIYVPAVAQTDYSIRGYELRVEPNFESGTVRIQTNVVIDNPGLLASFEFGNNPDYKLSLRSPKAVRVEEIEGGVRVVLEKPSREVRLEFEAEGKPGRSVDENRPVIDADSLFLLWSDRWYPIDFDHWAPVRTTIVLPKEFLALAPGRMISDEVSGEKHTVVFEEQHPAVAFSVFADRRWVEETRTVDGFTIRTLLYPECRKWAPQIFATSPDVLKFFSELHGGYPFSQFSFVTLKGIYARRSFNGFVGYRPEYLEKEMTTTGYDAHETSLIWWDGTTRGSGEGSWQWTEGLGDYVEAMYAESREKPLAANIERFRTEYLAIPAEKDIAYTELKGDTPQAIVHGKYPWLMHLLRLGIGDGAFRRGIRELFQKYSGRTFTMQEFVATFESASGSSLAWWQKGWLERKGPIEARFRYEVVEDGRNYRVRMTLAQQGERRRVPAEIGIRTRSGTEVRRVVFEEDGSAVELNSTEKPLEVTFDPNRRLPVRLLGREQVREGASAFSVDVRLPTQQKMTNVCGYWASTHEKLPTMISRDAAPIISFPMKRPSIGIVNTA